MKGKLTYLIYACIFITSLCYLSYIPTQSDFVHIIIPYSIAFIIYLRAIYRPIEHDVGKWIGVAIVVRFLLLFSFPNLSDDIYRFIWDGHLVLNGMNPYASTPSIIIDIAGNISGISEALYVKLNSPTYFTIYPTISQLLYVISSACSEEHWTFNSIGLKSLLFASELANMYVIYVILKLLNIAKARVLIYALNPLVIIEVMGNVHCEGVMVTAALLFYYCMIRRRMAVSAAALAIAIGTKLIPLIYLPYLFIRRIGFTFFVVLLVSLGILFLPLVLSIPNFGNSLNLYFQKFEFNASVYYVLRWLGYKLYGYNLISYVGPLLALLTAGLIFGFQYKYLVSITNKKAAPYFFLVAHVIFLLLATTVHPWYLILPLAWSVFTRLTFPIIWSGVIFLSYFHYSDSSYAHSLWMVSIQYSALIMAMLYDWKQNNFSIQNVEA